MTNYFLDFSTFSDAQAAQDLYSNSIRKGLGYDSYGNKTKFTAVVLSNPIPIRPADLKYFNAGTQEPTSKVSKFVYRGRIIDENSPHQFLPDPCDTTYASDPDTALKIVAMHTLFVSDSEMGVGESLPRLGSTVKVELTKNFFGYNISYGRHIKVMDNPGESSGDLAKECDKISEIMANADSLVSISSMSEPQIRSYFGKAGEQDLENGKLPSSVLKKSKYSNAKFLVDVVDDYNNLHDAFKNRFKKDLILTDHYRTYSAQVELRRRKPTLAARPGTSNHGWGLAFDFDHRDSSYGITGGKSGFDGDVYNWLKQNAPTYSFHNPSWAQEGGSGPDEPWHFESTKKSSFYGEPKTNTTPTVVTDGEADPTATTTT